MQQYKKKYKEIFNGSDAGKVYLDTQTAEF
jgi:hypothetical protein